MAEQIFEKNEEMKDIVKKLCEQRYDLFPKVDVEMIECSLRTDKPAPKNSKGGLKIKGIRGPLTSITDIRYIIFGYESEWKILPTEKKIAYLAYALKHVSVPSDEEEMELSEKGKSWEWGKLEKPDFTSFKTFARVFGVDWEEKTDLPNILEDEEVVI